MSRYRQQAVLIGSDVLGAPIKYELAINLKHAKALGLAAPGQAVTGAHSCAKNSGGYSKMVPPPS
jgi:hypothetical protein